MNVQLNDKVIVVTGSSRGIGAALIRRFADEKAKVVLNYCNSKDFAEEVSHYLENNNVEFLVYKADVSQENEVRGFYKAVKRKFGKIDILINNAGICKTSSVITTTEVNWDNVVNTNLKGAFLCTKYFAKDMIRQGKGKIINISSRYSDTGAMWQASYAVSKAGVTALTKTVAKELGEFDILVNSVCPGQINTGLEYLNEKGMDVMYEKEIKDYLQNVNYMDALLNFITYMCSDLF